MFRVLSVFGTRPEAIKMAPLVNALEQDARFLSMVCVSGQHRQMLDQVLDLFRIWPDYDLDLMQPDQDLAQFTARAISGLRDVIANAEPDVILVHGDTNTTLAAALAGFYARVPIAHVEAGLRTGDINSPHPEEMNRKLVSALAALHFAPSLGARANLIAEKVPEQAIAVTGNTGIDALFAAVRRIEATPALEAALNARIALAPGRRLLLVTGHRRENFGIGLERICEAISVIARRDDVEVVFPVHPNPSVADTVTMALAGAPNVRLLPPLDYLPFVNLLRRASIILTDSGGIQEEGPALGKPVLVLREETERTEVLDGGAARLIGTEVASIVGEVTRLLDDDKALAAQSLTLHPYGDGHSAKRIVKVLAEYLASSNAQSVAIA